jgi:hypothetical protein
LRAQERRRDGPAGRGSAAILDFEFSLISEIFETSRFLQAPMRFFRRAHGETHDLPEIGRSLQKSSAMRVRCDKRRTCARRISPGTGFDSNA